MSASSKYLLDIMSRVESPFHAIAAEALDNTPDVPEALANGFVAAPVATSSEVDAQERESVMPVLEFNAGSGNTEVADKIGSLEPEHTPVRQERKVSFEGWYLPCLFFNRLTRSVSDLPEDVHSSLNLVSGKWCLILSH